MMDTKGFEIKTGYLKSKDPLDIAVDHKLKLVTDYQVEGDSN